jgi:hypothetical protein
MKQTRLDSAIEAAINILIGFLISWAFWVWFVDPLLGINSSTRQCFLITVLFTLLSFFRQYFIRRWLNGKIIWESLLNAHPFRARRRPTNDRR